MYRRAFVNTDQIRQVIENCKKSSNEDLTKINARPPTHGYDIRKTCSRLKKRYLFQTEENIILLHWIYLGLKIQGSVAQQNWYGIQYVYSTLRIMTDLMRAR